ncbi:39S ribosomal protein L51, mitochondrial-like [Eriocheir sinensis]|uniref:39S ribosomal protein L51, mitochondrial-like n=1 Tax=Eriocheir sinensis TaxID=95602 RepID=UPI0021C56783|nr:39S ribosomal protein L51, mitochondrial-like [Eriocheir sinensis]
MASVVKNLLVPLGRLATPLYGAATAATTRTSLAWTPLVTSIRHRYHAEKVAKGPLLRNYGYKDQLHNKGLLPRVAEEKRRLPIPLFRPKNNWAERRALFGQNDYIDILGSGNLHPTSVSYNVPLWLRGFKGNEYQMLLRKRKVLGRNMAITRPSKLKEANKRIKWLYRYLNQKTKDYWWKDA